MFEKTTVDLIRGIRANKNNPNPYIQQCITECRTELKSTDLDIKAEAVLKLLYLHMLNGLDISFASFPIVETMSSGRYALKRVGYLGASETFNSETDVLMLTTNLIKKDLSSGTVHDVALTLNTVASLLTPSLSLDLSSDLLQLLTHSKHRVRRRAILIAYRIYIAFPDSLNSFLPRLRERLYADDAVSSCIVTVLGELATEGTGNVKQFLPFVPRLFELLSSSKDNWMLIKLIKLFNLLMPAEPRLVKKLAQPLMDIIESTTAISLQIEAINSVLSSSMLADDENDALARLCVDKLQLIVSESDQNLKYVALLAISKLAKTHLNLVTTLSESILIALDDEDLTVRQAALDLLQPLVNKRNLQPTIAKLMEQLLGSDLNDSYRANAVDCILTLCSINTFANISNFEWYIAVLIDLTKVARSRSIEISEALMNVTLRVSGIRAYCVGLMTRILADTERGEEDTPILRAVCWIVGEYAEFLSLPTNTLNTLIYMECPDEIHIITLQSVSKIFSMYATKDSSNYAVRANEIKSYVDKLIQYYEKHSSSSNLEIQQRSSQYLALFKTIESDLDTKGEKDTAPTCLTLLYSLYFTEELSAVGESAQKRVRKPEGLDLDSWINRKPKDVTFAVQEMKSDTIYKASAKEFVPEIQKAQRKKMRQERLQRQKDDPFYIPGFEIEPEESSPENSNPATPRYELDFDIDSIPIVKFEDGEVGTANLSVVKQEEPDVEPLQEEKVYEIAAEAMPEDAISEAEAQQSSLINAVRSATIASASQQPQKSSKNGDSLKKKKKKKRIVTID